MDFARVLDSSRTLDFARILDFFRYLSVAAHFVLVTVAAHQGPSGTNPNSSKGKQFRMKLTR